MPILSAVCSFSTVPGAVYGVHPLDESEGVRAENLVMGTPALQRGLDCELTSLYGITLWLSDEGTFISCSGPSALKFVWSGRSCSVILESCSEGSCEIIALINVAAILIHGASGLENWVAQQSLVEQEIANAARSRLH